MIIYGLTPEESRDYQIAWTVMYAGIVSMQFHPGYDGESPGLTYQDSAGCADAAMVEWRKRFLRPMAGGAPSST